MLSSYGPNFLDPRGKLLARSFDILGLYSIFIFQKSNPDVAPPFLSPMLQDEDVSEYIDGIQVEFPLLFGMFAYVSRKCICTVYIF
ncbi:mRNA cap guanine-N7 methyltransferase 2 [Platanthera guangdongensis]|uniref:mRNA cap guanine-N7 methyltransferase 2 n=1 Tax=Platanthera guangdongensis TaxID=2320717 RepID=A0ABR2LU82_9ASPA